MTLRGCGVASARSMPRSAQEVRREMLECVAQGRRVAEPLTREAAGLGVNEATCARLVVAAGGAVSVPTLSERVQAMQI